MKKKCIVLDLDDTLWGGVIGEDGLEGITLSLTPPGSYFVAFQQALLDLYHRGIILTINSSNNEVDALAAIRTHPNMILKEEHFAASRINWNDKVDNMRSLAKELNIGLDSMVFWDDSPTNRAAMRDLLPEVETPEVPADVSLYTKFLNDLPYFESNTITDEDKMRGNLYVTERLRREHEKAFTDRSEFLKTLNLQLNIFENDTTAIPRIAQLTEKTNQFNTNKIPMAEMALKTYMEDGAHTVIHGRVTDVFGDYGITAVALIATSPTEWRIETLLFSCRVLGRGIEEAFLYAIAQRMMERRVPVLRITFVKTKRNDPAEQFLISLTIKDTIDPHALTAPNWISIL